MRTAIGTRHAGSVPTTSSQSRRIDRQFLLVTLALVTVGFLTFASASLGLLARNNVRFSDVAFSQLLFGVCGGLVALFACSHIPFRFWRRAAPFLFGLAFLLTMLVFVPGIGYEANGARRWIELFGISFQPGELLKVSSVLMLAWYYSMFYRRIHEWRFALAGYGALIAVTGLPLIFQPDLGTFVIIAVMGMAVTIAACIRWIHLALLFAVLLLLGGVFVYAHPYTLERVLTFVAPSQDQQGAGYQIKQSLIAIGSGGLVGRGFGQSIQKFNHLPEPIGDSIFSVAAEEFGFLGTSVIVCLFMFLALRGLTIASRAPDRFGGLVATGIVILLVTQSFMNIGSMIGLMPLTGEPLVFMSHGGTSLFLSLASVGIVLNIGRYAKLEQKRT